MQKRTIVFVQSYVQFRPKRYRQTVSHNFLPRDTNCTPNKADRAEEDYMPKVKTECQQSKIKKNLEKLSPDK